MPTHGPGQAQIPRVTTPPPADALGQNAAAPSSAAVIALDTQAPKRIAGQFELNVEDLAVYPELENVLGESIRGALSNELDNEVFNGNAAGLNGSVFAGWLTSRSPQPSKHSPPASVGLQNWWTACTRTRSV